MLKSLSDALESKGYTAMTPVQEAVTAPELEGSDLLVSAQTGSGKTVGFGLAIAPTLLGDAERFGPAATPLALVIAPTRELALQVQREFQWLYGLTGAIVASCVGGMDMRTERRNLERGAHIVVGTPGRLRDHLQRGSLDMTDIRAVVLDEADEMLDLGFREDLEFILGTAPESRRTLMFSATVPPAIAGLAKNYQKPDARRITTLSGTSQHADIDYQALNVGANDVEGAIINVLRYHEAPTAMVFCNTRAMVSRLTARFANRGFSVVALSGELSQTERTHALQSMRDGRARICVATDVAARGIDLPNLDLVIHADLPSSSEALLHRSGRTGRAGRAGISTLIVPGSARKKAERLLKFAKITATWGVPPTAEAVLRRDEERLLSDPMWQVGVSPEDAGFVAELLARFSPEAIAGACLSLFRAGRSAPEEVSEAAPPKPREAFGPSGWIALSVGRDKRAEPRWLLPLLCRSGNLDKTGIGAIRVQDAETFVELTVPALASLFAAIGPDGTLEDGITVRRLEGTPDFATSAPQKSAYVKREDRVRAEPDADGPAPVRKPRHVPRAATWTPDGDVEAAPAPVVTDAPVAAPVPEPSEPDQAASETPRAGAPEAPQVYKPRAEVALPARREEAPGAVTAYKPAAKGPVRKPAAYKGKSEDYAGTPKPAYKSKSEGYGGVRPVGTDRPGYKGKSDEAGGTGKPAYKGKSEGSVGARPTGAGKPAYKGKSEGTGFAGKPAYKGKSEGYAGARPEGAARPAYKGKNDGAAGAGKPAYKGKSEGYAGTRPDGAARPAYKGKSEGPGGAKPAYKGKSEGYAGTRSSEPSKSYAKKPYAAAGKPAASAGAYKDGAADPSRPLRKPGKVRPAGPRKGS